MDYRILTRLPMPTITWQHSHGLPHFPRICPSHNVELIKCAIRVVYANMVTYTYVHVTADQVL